MDKTGLEAAQRNPEIFQTRRRTERCNVALQRYNIARLAYRISPCQPQFAFFRHKPARNFRQASTDQQPQHSPALASIFTPSAVWGPTACIPFTTHVASAWITRIVTLIWSVTDWHARPVCLLGQPPRQSHDPALRLGSHRLDRCVECQQTGLFGNDRALRWQKMVHEQ